MKRNLLILAGAAFMLVGVTSCAKKCQDCTLLGDTEEICEDDFNSKDEYEDAIALVEAFGGDCK